MSAKIAVFGEALVDLIEHQDNQYRACLGGAPFNFALAMAKQQHNTQFLTPISYDHFGEQLLAKLKQANIKYSLRSHLPTSLAAVNLDENGNAAYNFYRQGIADRDYHLEQNNRLS